MVFGGGGGGGASLQSSELCLSGHRVGLEERN